MAYWHKVAAAAAVLALLLWWLFPDRPPLDGVSEYGHLWQPGQPAHAAPPPLWSAAVLACCVGLLACLGYGLGRWEGDDG